MADQQAEGSDLFDRLDREFMILNWLAYINFVLLYALFLFWP